VSAIPDPSLTESRYTRLWPAVLGVGVPPGDDHDQSQQDAENDADERHPVGGEADRRRLERHESEKRDRFEILLLVLVAVSVLMALTALVLVVSST